MSIFGRDFTTIVRGTEWISIHTSKITKKKIKKYRNFTNYLNSVYGAKNWKIVYVENNNLLTREYIIKMLKTSFTIFNKKNEINRGKVNNWISSMDIEPIPELIHDLKNDKILYDVLDMIATAFSNFSRETFTEKGEFIETTSIIFFFYEQQDLLHKISFTDPRSPYNAPTNHTSGVEVSIHDFFEKIRFIQVKSEILIDKKDLSVSMFLRKDLKLGKGKKGAQLAHGAVSLLFQPQIRSEFNNLWLKNHNRCISIYYVKGLQQLLTIQRLCRKNTINNALISDAGHTQIDPGTSTCIGVGPIPRFWEDVLAEEVGAIMIKSL